MKYMHYIHIYIYSIRICILTPTIISFMYQPFWWHRPFRIYLPSQLVDSPPSEKVLELPNLNRLTPAGVCKWHKRGFSSKQFVALFDWLDLHGYHIWSGIHILVYTTYSLYTTYPWYTTYLFHFKFEISEAAAPARSSPSSASASVRGASRGWTRRRRVTMYGGARWRRWPRERPDTGGSRRICWKNGGRGGGVG